MGFKIKGLLATICINVFAVMFVDVASETVRYQQAIQGLDYTIDTAVDLAITNTMASEEFFSEEYQYLTEFASVSDRGANSGDILTSNMKILRNEWVSGNAYIMTMFYNERGRFPSTQYEYNSYASTNGSPKQIYEYMFGKVNSDLYNPNIQWATPNDPSVPISLAGRKPTTNFRRYYEEVGHKIVSEQYIKARSADGSSWVFQEDTIPVLAQMGLELDDINKPNVQNTRTGNNYVVVEHEGRYLDASLQRTKYYLTPYSLGVTYLDPTVLKTNCLANLENLIRFSKSKQVGDGNAEVNGSDLMNTYRSADGCITTSYYNDNNAGVTTDAVSHLGGSNWIMNDGEVEYDLRTLQVKVDYFVVDFFDEANWRIVNEIQGSTPYESDLTKLPKKLKDSYTDQANADVSGDRIVAKVSARIKLHIPYKSSIMHWYINNSLAGATSGVSEHYDAPIYDETVDGIKADSDGVWYYYTTYAAITE